MAAVVQSTATNQGSGVTSITLSLTGVVAGNALVIEGAFSPLSATDSVAYPAGWTSAASVATPGGNSYAVLGVITGVTAGTHAITISSSLGNSTYWAIRMHEVSGLASSPVDSAAIATGTTTGTTLALTSPAATTGKSIAFSPLAYDNANTYSGILSASSPWTTLWYIGNASVEAGAGADQVYAGVSTPTVTWSGMTADTGGWATAIVPLLAAATGNSGVSATTDGADASAAASRQTLAGSASFIDGADTSTATGTVASSSITGVSATADRADTSVASSAQYMTGVSATTDGVDVSAASASLQVTSTLAATDGADTSAASAALSLSASSFTTDGADTSAASAAQVMLGTSATTDSADINSASGTVGTATITASSATTDGADTLTSTSNLSISASSATTDGADTNTGTAILYSYATSATTDSADVPSVVTSLLIYTTGSPRDGPDVSTATGSIPVSGYSATTDGQDVSTATGIVPITGYSATVDGADVNVAYGNDSKFGVLRAYLTNGQLVATVQPKDNTLPLDSTTWAYLSSLLGTDYCYLVIGGKEVVKVQGLESPNVALVVRGLEGTQRELWPTGTAVNYEITASEIQDAVNYVGYQLTINYPLLYNAGNLSYDEMGIIGLGGVDVEGSDEGLWIIQDIPDNVGCYNPMVPGQPPPIPPNYFDLRIITEGYYRQTSDGSYRTISLNNAILPVIVNYFNLRSVTDGSFRVTSDGSYREFR